ncbi:hypothetical protein ABG768_012421 [Culter alburnus]|uniref:Uncharacterized protein n=1 Tax=Culter alburnus TaxID=194366 RepID=A0AAW1ZD59_CULAL
MEFSMAHKQRIRSYVLMCTCLLALPSGRDALTCCRRDFSNGSTSCHLSDAPDPTCNTEWIADDIVVVDESGETDLTRVQHAEPQTLILKERHTKVIFQMEYLCNGAL